MGWIDLQRRPVMFPGMFGGGPEPLAEHKSQRLFWSNLKNFALFVAAVTLLGAAVHKVETRASDILLEAAVEK